LLIENIFKNAIEIPTDLSKPLLMPLWVLQSTFWPSGAKSRGEIMASAVDNYLGEADNCM
jgi:hypothetical protein